MAMVSFAHAQPASELQDRLSAVYEGSALPGVSVALADAQGVTYTSVFGWADTVSNQQLTADTRFVAGGLGEAFVAIALAIAVEEGRISWDTPLKEVLPFEMAYAERGGKPVTVRHLATHTAGLRDQSSDFMRSFLLRSEPDYNNPALSRGQRRDLRNVQYNQQYTLGYFLRMMLTRDGQFFGRNTIKNDEPGTVYAHSDVGVALGGYIIESVYMMGFDEFVGRKILDPLGMHSTTWNLGPETAKYVSAHFDSSLVRLPQYDSILFPAHGLYTTADDLGKFLAEMIRGVKGEGKIASAETFKTVFSPQYGTTQRPAGTPTNLLNSALFWGISDGSYQLGGTGLGVTGFVSFDPVTGTGRVFLTNADIDSRLQFRRAFDEMWRLLGEYAPVMAEQ